jgi:2-dehydropantoate 2-reductase
MNKQILIFGAGAIGTYLGGSLALAGHEVLFIEKGRDIPTLRHQGLRLTLQEKEHHLSGVEFFSSLEILQQRDIDLVILAVKSYHLDAILPGLFAHKADLPPLLCLQNGVESEKTIGDALGDHRLIIPGTVTSAIDRIDKGRIIVQKTRGMGIAGEHSRLEEYKDTFNNAGLNCAVYRRADAMKWSKLITNVLGNASSAILDFPPSTIFAHPGLYQVEMEQIREALKVMRKQRIPSVNLPGVPVASLAAIVRFLPATVSQPLLSNLVGKGRGKKMPSFHIDLYSGKGSSEVGALNGAIVQAGIKTRVATPVNRFLTNLLMGLIAGDIPLTRYQHKPDLFLNDLTSFKESGSFS